MSSKCCRCGKLPRFYLVLTDKYTKELFSTCLLCYTSTEVINRYMHCQLCESKSITKQTEGTKKDLWLCRHCSDRWNLYYSTNCNLCSILLSDTTGRHHNDIKKKDGAICSSCYKAKRKTIDKKRRDRRRRHGI